MVINNRPVSDNILRIISERGYKQSAVARKAGYSRQTFGYMVHVPQWNSGVCQWRNTRLMVCAGLRGTPEVYPSKGNFLDDPQADCRL